MVTNIAKAQNSEFRVSKIRSLNVTEVIGSSIVIVWHVSLTKLEKKYPHQLLDKQIHDNTTSNS